MMDGALRALLDAFSWLGSYLVTITQPFGWSLARGDVPSAAPLVILGTNMAPGSDDILAFSSLAWTSYGWPTADQTLRVSSTSANDDGAPVGTGALTIRIWWLDSANVEATTDVTLDGVNLVNSAAATARRVNRVEVLTVGTLGYNDGTITVYATDGATILAQIPARRGVSDGCIQTVPAGKRDVIFALVPGGTTLGDLRFRLCARTGPLAPWVVQFEFQEKIADSVQQPARSITLEAGTDYAVELFSAASVATGTLYGARVTL